MSEYSQLSNCKLLAPCLAYLGRVDQSWMDVACWKLSARFIVALSEAVVTGFFWEVFDLYTCVLGSGLCDQVERASVQWSTCTIMPGSNGCAGGGGVSNGHRSCCKKCTLWIPMAYGPIMTPLPMLAEEMGEGEHWHCMTLGWQALEITDGFIARVIVIWSGSVTVDCRKLSDVVHLFMARYCCC